jgi:hypothetical protein
MVMQRRVDLLVKVDLDDPEVDDFRLDVQRSLFIILFIIYISTRTEYLEKIVNFAGQFRRQRSERVPRTRQLVPNQVLVRVEHLFRVQWHFHTVILLFIRHERTVHEERLIRLDLTTCWLSYIYDLFRKYLQIQFIFVFLRNLDVVFQRYP